MSKLFGDSGKKKLSFNRKRPVAELDPSKKDYPKCKFIIK